MAVVNGDRVFIVGLYENPEDDAVLDAAVKSGVNLLHAAANREALDRLQAHGAWGWLNTGYNIDLSEDTETRTAAIEKLAADFSDHPTLLSWEVPDEALWNVWYGPSQWRHGAEPQLLREHIAALEDKETAKELGARLDESGRLRGRGDYAASETIADALWEALGKTSPNPGYGLTTSAERARKMASGMRAGYEKMRAIDPAHPVVMNHAPRNSIQQLALFGRAADVIACDIYPVPVSPHVGHSDLRNKSMTSVGAYTDRMQASAPGKPVWLVLQGFGWPDIQPERKEEERKLLRRPTREETRFMAYDAIVHGARGLVYWGTAYVEKDSPFWNDLLGVFSELDALQPVLSAPDTSIPISVSLQETFGSLDQGVLVLGKDTPEGLCLIVVNECSDPLVSTLGGLEKLNGKRYRISGTEEVVTVGDGQLRLAMPGQSVFVCLPE